MPKPFKRALCWIRRDLRLSDHTALAAATEQAEATAVVFVFDTNILDALEDRDDKRLTFIHRSLRELDEKLRACGSILLTGKGDPRTIVPSLARKLEVDAVFTARDYEPYAKERDAAVHQALAKHGIALRTEKDSVIFEGGEVLSGAGQPFRVFSPYARAWRKRFDARRDAAEHAPDLKAILPESVLAPFASPWSMHDIGFAESELWLDAGEEAGHERLQSFGTKIGGYDEARNFPSQEGTSGLSVHFRFGTISVREAVRRALEHGSEGADKWLNELIWRDFYQDVLHHHPHVVELPFQAQYGKLRYPGKDAHFEAWRDGQTGYPLVDAAMRCLNQTGWMHNRLRMVVASFLTKDLLVDYRKGEAHFARRLLDFDLASNNGGWQWAASTGSDPQPYFRIFNPITQSQKFDADGEFIRAYVPELRELTGRAIHFPSVATPMELKAAGVELGVDYPLPIVDHAEQRQRAIDLLASARS